MLEKDGHAVVIDVQISSHSNIREKEQDDQEILRAGRRAAKIVEGEGNSGPLDNLKTRGGDSQTGRMAPADFRSSI